MIARVNAEDFAVDSWTSSKAKVLTCTLQTNEIESLIGPTGADGPSLAWILPDMTIPGERPHGLDVDISHTMEGVARTKSTIQIRI